MKGFVRVAWAATVAEQQQLVGTAAVRTNLWLQPVLLQTEMARDRQQACVWVYGCISTRAVAGSRMVLTMAKYGYSGLVQVCPWLQPVLLKTEMARDRQQACVWVYGCISTRAVAGSRMVLTMAKYGYPGLVQVCPCLCHCARSVVIGTVLGARQGVVYMILCCVC
jgi:hypothetical protein